MGSQYQRMSTIQADEVRIGCDNMQLFFLPIGSAFDVVIKNLHDASDPDTPITDATITVTVQDANGDDVAGAIDVSMPHKGSGEYRGTVTPDSDLTENERYTVIITSSNYTAEWRDVAAAQFQPFTAC